MHKQSLSKKLMAIVLAASMVTSGFSSQAIAEAANPSTDETVPEVVLDEDEAAVNQGEFVDDDGQDQQTLDETAEQEGDITEEEDTSQVLDDDVSDEPYDHEEDVASTDDVVPGRTR